MKVTFGKFLFFQRRAIMMYMFIMAFITIMLFVEPTMPIHFQNIVYIHIVAFVIFSLYITVEFLYIKKHISQVETHWTNGYFIQEGVGESKTYEQYLYGQLFQMVNEKHQEKMRSITKDKKDTLEYMTSWFHEIKTPIAVSRLIIEQSPTNAVMESIEEEINLVENYVEQALYFIRTDEFNHDYFILQTELDQLVRSVIKQHAKIFIKKKIKLELRVEPIEIQTDKKWLAYVLSQIISNSLKYTADAGTIMIQSEEDSKEVRLVISDNGIGIEQADVQRIFEKGFTGMNGRAHGKSTGMGLYLAKKLANKLGHELSVSSKEKEYTSMTIHFPKGQDYYSI
ncbi:sensor histidine kinase [Bacillus sp. FJAT-52991]|uniref:histidine kinase n=1 Tax=Bacillus kandeliae TaxID=3129297 RepID=A0ABZ2N544_9BACI